MERVAPLGTGGIDQLGTVVVSQLVGKAGVADGAELGLDTGCLGSGRMAVGGDGAGVAVLAAGAGVGHDALLSTGGLKGHSSQMVVTESLRQNLTADRTGLVGRTGGGVSLGVTGGIYGGVGVGIVTTGAGVGGVALCRAGGGDSHRDVVVACRVVQQLTADLAELGLGAGGLRSGGVRLDVGVGVPIDVIATGTGVGGVAHGRTGGLGHSVGVLVTRRVRQKSAANGTELRRGTGSRVSGGVPLGGGKAVIVGVLTAGADVGGVALRHTGGLDGVLLVIVSQGGDQNRIADGAVLSGLAGGGSALGMTVGGAVGEGLLSCLSADAGLVVQSGIRAGGRGGEVELLDNGLIEGVIGMEDQGLRYLGVVVSNVDLSPFLLGAAVQNPV